MYRPPGTPPSEGASVSKRPHFSHKGGRELVPVHPRRTGLPPPSYSLPPLPLFPPSPNAPSPPSSAARLARLAVFPMPLLLPVPGQVTEIVPAGRGDPTSGLAPCQDTMLNRPGVGPGDPYSFVLLVQVLFLAAAFTWLALQLLCRLNAAAQLRPIHAHPPPPSRRARGRSSRLPRALCRSRRRVVRGARKSWAGFGACGAAAALVLTLFTHTAQAETCPPSATPVRA